MDRTEKIDAIWSFATSPLFDESERVALRWAIAAGSSPNEVTREHYDDLHRFYDDDQQTPENVEIDPPSDADALGEAYGNEREGDAG